MTIEIINTRTGGSGFGARGSGQEKRGMREENEGRERRKRDR